uniref:7TM_GPCR_Srx domain-containing protein n=2 Tax=Caenorhabditis tropicalis TaxID=1561998 RepID=A0A1I7U6T0_9PELO
MTMCIFNVIVDSITIWKVRKVRSSQGKTKFQKKEIDFLKQSFGQAFFLLIAVPSYYFIPLYLSNPLSLFVMGTLFWPSIHSFDGVLTLYFNMEIRKTIKRKFGRGTVSVNNSVIIGGKSSTRMF